MEKKEVEICYSFQLLLYICIKIKSFMKRFFLFLIILLLPFVVLAQGRVKRNIPKDAIFYNANWKGVSSAKQASYYRILSVDKRGQKILHDYYITGQLCAEKQYISVSKTDDKQTVLTGTARTFYKSGKTESIMKYSNGKANGRAVSFFANGNVGMKLNYANGLLNGTSYTYSERGKLEFTTVWKNGTKVSERSGGTDKYINKATGKDDFVESYRYGGKIVKEHTHAVTSDSTPKAAHSNDHNPHIATHEIESELVVTYSNSIEAEQTSDTDLANNVKYPPMEGVQNGPVEKLQSLHKSTDFKFSFMYELLVNGDQRTNEMHFFDNIGAAHGLILAQVIKGYGAQKELTYSYNMHYDEALGNDVVTGTHPRQMGFWGVGLNNRFTTQRINLYTWSEEEMIRFAEDALSYGYKVLGEDDYLSLNGNFVLGHPEHNKKGDDFAVVISFTHMEDAYAGLYHITLERK